MTNSVLQVLYKTLKKHTNPKVHISPQIRVNHKKKIVRVCSVVFTEKHGCREFLFDGQSHHNIIGVYSTFSRAKTLDCILVINDISNFHKLYIPLLDSLVSLSESTKSFISSRSRSSLKQIVKIPSNNITSAGCIVTDSFCLQLKKKGKRNNYDRDKSL